MGTWPSLPYDEWRDTYDTLHAHAQVLGKLEVALAPPQPELQHAALHLTARGWDTSPLPAPDGSGAIVVALDLRTHHAVVEHHDGRVRTVPLTPHRPVGDVTRDVLAAVTALAGRVEIKPNPQEVPWTVALDEDTEHHTYEPGHVTRYFDAATRAALALSEIAAPYRGRRTPVNAWWGSFDFAVSLYSGARADPPSRDFITRNSADAQMIEFGWWPGDHRHPRAAFYGYARPAPTDFAAGRLVPDAAHWDTELGEFLFDWDDVIASHDPLDAVLQFGRSLVAHACAVCGWDPALAATAQGVPPPVN
jgi:hypothetical protein